MNKREVKCHPEHGQQLGNVIGPQHQRADDEFRKLRSVEDGDVDAKSLTKLEKWWRVGAHGFQVLMNAVDRSASSLICEAH